MISPIICVHIRLAESRVCLNDPLSFYKVEDSDSLRLMIMNLDVLFMESENGVIESPLGNIEESKIHSRMQSAFQIEKC